MHPRRCSSVFSRPSQQMSQDRRGELKQNARKSEVRATDQISGAEICGDWKVGSASAEGPATVQSAARTAQGKCGLCRTAMRGARRDHVGNVGRPSPGWTVAAIKRRLRVHLREEYNAWTYFPCSNIPRLVPRPSDAER